MRVAVGVGVFVEVGKVGVRVGVRVDVLVAVGVNGVNVGVEVGVSVEVGVLVGLGVSVTVAVSVGVEVGVSVGCGRASCTHAENSDVLFAAPSFSEETVAEEVMKVCPSTGVNVVLNVACPVSSLVTSKPPNSV